MKHTKKPLSILLTICMIVGLLPWTAMPVLATTTSTITVGGTDYMLFTGFTATDGTNDDYGNMVDGDTSTSFHVLASDAFVEFSTDEPIIPKGYIFNTYMDGNFFPTSWVLKAKVETSDEWTTLSTGSGGTTSGTEFTRSYDNNENNSYKYFRFEVTRSGYGNNDNIWLTEIRLYGFENLTYTHLTVRAATCTEVGIKQECYRRSDGKYFTDETGATELAESDVIDPMIAHTGVHHAADANHIEYWQCSMCSKYFSDASCTTEITEAQTLVVKYLDVNGTLTTLNENATAVTSTTTSWSNGWYMLYDDETIANRISVSGTVNLILGNGATLTASKGITVGSNNTLNIYAQSDDEATMGTLVADATSETGYAGIGGESNSHPNCGTIVINGGKITANGNEAGIGGGGYQSTNGNITINGGIVNATAGSYSNSAGIGGGKNGYVASVTLNGGIITATGDTQYSGAGIGTGSYGGNGTMTVTIGSGVKKLVATKGDGSECIGKESHAQTTVNVVFKNGNTTVTGNAKDAVFYDTGEGSVRQVRAKALNHAVTMSDDLKANITATPEYALTGETVTLTLGTAVDASTLKVNDGTSDLTLTDAGNRQYNFTMPDGDVTVTATAAQSYTVTLPANMEIISATNAADANGKYISGTVITFKASFPYAASDVSDGTNTLTTTDGIYSVTIGTADVTITATVERNSPIDLSGAIDDFTVINNDVLTGTTSHTVTIASGAGISLSSATISGGIVCEGTATITLVGTNSTTGAQYKAGIQIGGSGTTLTIRGDGSLTATGGDGGAGIGTSVVSGSDSFTGGNIIIESGTVTAIGTEFDHNTHQGGDGIGTGYIYASALGQIGTVTFYDGIDKVDASSIKDFSSVVYMHGETNVTANKTNYFTIDEDGDHKTITPPHTHSFTYSASGAEITATCDGAGHCPLADHKATLTIAAPTGTLTYDGTAKAATLDGLEAFNSATGLSINANSIVYKKGSTTLNGAPTGAGTYTASITAGDATASVSYTILPSTVIVNVTDNGTVTYNDKVATNGEVIGVVADKGTDVTLTFAPENGYAVSIEYGYTNNSGTTASGIKLPINGSAATLTVPNDLKDGTYVNLTVTFAPALNGGADEASAVALTDNTVTNFAGGWYKVDSNITFDHTLNLLGDTHLIIDDGKTMTVNTATSEGILSDYTLFVSGEGTLSVATTGDYGIAVCVGNYVQTGATVTASGYIGIRCTDDFIGFDFDNDFTFSGGQLTATGSGGDGIRADNTITLGWTNPADRITASSYYASGTVKVADGEALTDVSGHFYNGTLSADDLTAISGKALWPVATMDNIPDQTYTGSEIKPEPLVLAGSLSLTKGTDYVYSYTNNTDVGTATVRATFQGNYASLGYVEKEFNIVSHIHNFSYSAEGATITATCSAADCTLTNRQATLTIAAPTSLTYDGTAKAATVTGDTAVLGTPSITYTKQGDNTFTGTPTDAGTYTASITVEGQTASVSYTVAPKSVTITGLSVSNKEYDGTTTATATGGTIDGKVGNDNVSFTAGTAAFADANVGTGKTVTFSGYSLTGTAAGNYTLSAQPASVTADITAKSVTITGLGAANKTYDGNTTATVTGTATISGLVSGDAVTVTAGTAAFADKNVGENKTVTFSGYSLTGTAASNYTLSGQPASATAAITAKEVGLSWSNTSFTYDGSEHVPTATATGLVSGDSCTVTVTGGQTNAGTYTAEATGLSNSNYKLPAAKTTSFTIAKANQPAPTLTSPVTITTGDTATITGVTASMEYSTDNKTWTACASPFSFGKGVYYIRLAEDANHNASPAATVVVKKDGEHSLTVTGGTGSGIYEKDAQVSVSVTIPAGQKFKNWTAAGITLTDEQKAAASITVTMPDSDVTLTANFEDLTVTGITLNKTSLSLAPNAAATLTVSYQPSGVKDTYKGVTWTSSNESVATVDGSGEVTAKAEGTATITAKSTSNTSAEATCTVTVKKQSPTPTPTPSYDPTPSGRDDTPSTPSTTTTTTTDSTTTTNADGGKTESTSKTTETKNSDGSTTAKTTETATTTAADGSKTESKSETSTTTKANTDGTTTASTTATQTATTTDANGAKTTTETKTEAKETLDKSGNGTVEAKTTETVKDANGKVTETTVTESKGTVETAADGAKTTTTTNTATTTDANGNKTTTVTTEQTVEKADGSTGSVVTNENGETVSVTATISEKAVEQAQKSGDAVTVPVTVTATNDAATATAVEITVPQGAESVKVEIPVENVKPGTVAVIVNPDGTEEIVKTSTTSDEGVVLTLDAGATVKLVDNTKPMNDVKGDEWYADNIAWATSHEVMNGVGGGNFAPNDPTTQGMMEQILFNIDGNERVTPAEGEAWWNAADGWAAQGGVTDGVASHDPAAPATREVDILMMFNYAKAQGYDTSARASLDAFSDASSVSAEAREAMAWAVAVGIINGSTDENGNVILDAQGVATRAQVSTMAERFCENVVK